MEDYVKSNLDYNGECWQANVFNPNFLACRSTKERDAWMAIHMNDIDMVRLLLDQEPFEIFTNKSHYIRSWQGYERDNSCSDKEILFDAQFTNVVLKATELGLYDILDLIITANPLSMYTSSTVCVHKN